MTSSVYFFIVFQVIKNKFTGQVAGYGFVNFSNDQQALTAMHRLNGKIMPYSQPPTRYSYLLTSLRTILDQQVAT
jgi:hypothetical protein